MHTEGFKDESGFARVATIKEVCAKDFNLSIPLFVEPDPTNGTNTAQKSALLSGALNDWLTSSEPVAAALRTILPNIKLPQNRQGLRGNNTSKLIKERTRWKQVRFGDVVGNVNKTESDPIGAGIERFIGLEHLEPGSLHVRAWGNVAEGTTFTRRCKPGQVLFGKRRAYQRKVAVAEFDALVSGDIYVLAPKDERLLPGLLPFICLSERFFQYAVETSAGSLSPRTNWSSLSEFEFELPPIDQQQRLVDVLSAADDSIESWRRFRKQHDQYMRTFASHVTMSGLSGGVTQPSPIGAIPANWQFALIGELTKSSAFGPRFPGSKYSSTGNVKTIRTTDFDHSGGINFEEIPEANVPEDTAESHKLRDGDFLLSRSGEYAGLTAIFSDPLDGKTYIPAAFLIRYRFDEVLDPQYLHALCCSDFGERNVMPLATGSAQPNISGTRFSGLHIPVPPAGEQKAIVSAISDLSRCSRSIAMKEERSRDLIAALINSIVGGVE